MSTFLESLPTGKLQYGPYSPSRLDTGICGYAFHKQYVEKVDQKRVDNLAASRGSVVHEVFEHMCEKMKAGDYAFNEEECRKWMSESIGRYPAAYEDTEMIWECIKKFADNPPKDMPADAEIERKLALTADMKECDYDSPDALVRGRADLLWFDENLVAHILDHKTQPNVEEASTFQMGVYALVIARTYDLEQVYTKIYFARYGKYSKDHLWTEEDLKTIENLLLSRVETIEHRTVWDATPHNGCQYCGHRTTCPIYKDNFKVDEDTGAVSVIDKDVFNPHADVYRAQKLAAVAIQLEELLAVATKNLNTFVKEHGQPIVCGNKAFMFKPKEDIDWTYVNRTQRASIADCLKRNGIEPMNYAAFSKKSFSPIYYSEDDKAAMFSELDLLMPRKTTTTFNSYKV